MRIGSGRKNDYAIVAVAMFKTLRLGIRDQFRQYPFNLAIRENGAIVGHSNLGARDSEKIMADSGIFVSA